MSVVRVQRVEMEDERIYDNGDAKIKQIIIETGDGNRNGSQLKR